MEMKIVILISLSLGLIAGWNNDKAMESYHDPKGTFLENTIPPLAIAFVIYAFFQLISFGFMAILQILLGSYIGNQVHRFLKKVKNK